MSKETNGTFDVANFDLHQCPLCEANKKVAELEADNERLREERLAFAKHATSLEAEYQELESDYKKLLKRDTNNLKKLIYLKAQLEALDPYLYHDEDCSRSMIKRKCTCGLQAILEKE